MTSHMFQGIGAFHPSFFQEHILFHVSSVCSKFPLSGIVNLCHLFFLDQSG